MLSKELPCFHLHWNRPLGLLVDGGLVQNIGRGLQVCTVGVHHCGKEGKRLLRRQNSRKGRLMYGPHGKKQQHGFKPVWTCLVVTAFTDIFSTDNYNGNTELVSSKENRKKNRQVIWWTFQSMTHISCLFRNIPSGVKSIRKFFISQDASWVFDPNKCRKLEMTAACSCKINNCTRETEWSLIIFALQRY